MVAAAPSPASEAVLQSPMTWLLDIDGTLVLTDDIYLNVFKVARVLCARTLFAESFMPLSRRKPHRQHCAAFDPQDAIGRSPDRRVATCRRSC